MQPLQPYKTEALPDGKGGTEIPPSAPGELSGIPKKMSALQLIITTA